METEQTPRKQNNNIPSVGNTNHPKWLMPSGSSTAKFWGSSKPDRCQFTTPTHLWRVGGGGWVGGWVTSRCGCGRALSLPRSGRCCRFPLGVRERPSGRPRARPPLPLSCFRCRCARLCTPEEEVETLRSFFFPIRLHVSTAPESSA